MPAHIRRAAWRYDRGDRNLRRRPRPPAPQAKNPRLLHRHPCLPHHVRGVRGAAALCRHRHLVQADRGDHDRAHFRAPSKLDRRALVEGVEHALHRARLRRHQAGLLHLVQDSLPEPRAVDRRLVRHRLRPGALERALGEHFSLHPLHLRLRAVPDHHDPAHRDRRELRRLRHGARHRDRARGRSRCRSSPSSSAISTRTSRASS